MFTVTRILSKAAPKAAKAAAVTGNHEPLVKLFGIHARYANAAYTAASKKGSLDKVEVELQSLKETATKNATLKGFMANPTIPRNQKEKVMADLLDGKMSDVTCNLMSALAGNARLNETVKVVDAYTELMKAKRGEVDAVVTSAEPLSAAQAKAVSEALSTQVGKDKKIVMTMNVDASILGGLQIQIGDKFMDLSAGEQINNISRGLGGN